jgi:hypothetical protein
MVLVAIQQTKLLTGCGGRLVSTKQFYSLVTFTLAIRPWSNFKEVIWDQGKTDQFVSLVCAYFRFIWTYVHNRPYLPPTKFCERQALEFQALFLKVYRRRSVHVQQSNMEISKFKLSLTKAAQHNMCITKTTATCFVPAIKADENIPQNWHRKSVNAVGPHGLGVGPYSWWGQSDKVITLKSPQKEVSSFGIIFRCLTASRILG